MNFAVVGSGIAGLAAAYRLSSWAHVTLLEAGEHFGGHTRTIDVTLPGQDGQLVTHGVDTGFLVFNHRTYPGLTALLEELRVPAAPSTMSFSVQLPGPDGQPALEWGGASLATVFAQRRNLVRPRFWAMLADLLRFNRLCTTLARRGDDAALAEPLGAFLDRHGFGRALRDWYLLPMLGCIWSCPTEQMLAFPVGTMIRFCHNHGLLQVYGRPTWFTIPGGARQYVQRIVARLADARLRTPVRRIERDPAGVTVITDAGRARFDAVVLATHSDQALALLAQPTDQERALLGAIRYQRNRAVLHTDTSVMPKRRSVWSAWNYERAADAGTEAARVCLHYWLNALQPLPFRTPLIETLNPVRPIDPASVIDEVEFEHPVFDHAAVAAQRQIAALQGRQRTWFAGAWLGYGFHEDGLRAGDAAAQAIEKAWRGWRAAA
ncbi:HpnE: squalene-associated FAD-dependent desaturase [Tepidimonas alkaliphilus]|uniref:HpnE: squalene-associated FAD-dependent desaturase n=1 Tax=Tepidimonas alkaliphilus TaxID=2588942 RepID=A0A554W454_9BURK|nr:FAD-dependent oxidoreductase [Tepidimonas alkaliphilus]TSE18365.1 HpnE: squalene-associated FAD-dependent desaturase [Tepidimonas alkaliphilus]